MDSQRDDLGRFLPGHDNLSPGSPTKDRRGANRRKAIAAYLSRLDEQGPMQEHRGDRGKWLPGKPPGPGQPSRYVRRWRRAQQDAAALLLLIEGLKEEDDDD
jgi:hypothetical protein